MRVSPIITEVATGFLGYREIGQNEAFEHPVFQKLMYRHGWRPGMAWCAFFCELVYWEVYKERRDEITRLFNASAVQTYYNFVNGGWTHSGVPVRGSLAVWQQYRDGVKDWRGHIAIVESSEIDSNMQGVITTIDGNSNSDGSRNGFEVARVKRVLNWGEDNGLRILGFIIPKEI